MSNTIQPSYGTQAYSAPTQEIHALGNVPPGSKAVVIHPKVQERRSPPNQRPCMYFAPEDTHRRRTSPQTRPRR